jgi:hypothetical protein
VVEFESVNTRSDLVSRVGTSLARLESVAMTLEEHAVPNLLHRIRDLESQVAQLQIEKRILVQQLERLEADYAQMQRGHQAWVNKQAK